MKLMTKSRFQNHALSSPSEYAIRILSQQYDVIHFPGCVNREEGGEGNPIRLHDPEANGTWEERWRDGQIDGSRQPECHSEKRKTRRRRESERASERDREREKERKTEGTYARERTKRVEGKQEGRMNARVGESRGERKRSERVERCTTTNASPSDDPRSQCNGPVNTTISFSQRYSIHPGCSHLSHLDLRTKSWYVFPRFLWFLMRQKDISYSELTLTAQLETAFFHNARRDREKPEKESALRSPTSCILFGDKHGTWIRVLQFSSQAGNVTSNEFHVREEDLSISKALLMLHTRQQLKRKGRARQAKIIVDVVSIVSSQPWPMPNGQARKAQLATEANTPFRYGCLHVFGLDFQSEQLNQVSGVLSFYGHTDTKVYAFRSSKELKAILIISKNFTTVPKYRGLFRGESTVGTPIKRTEMMTFRFHVVIVLIAADLLQNPVSTAALQSERPMTGKRRGALNPVYKQSKFKLRMYVLVDDDTLIVPFLYSTTCNRFFFHPTESNLLGNLCACGTREQTLFSSRKCQSQRSFSFKRLLTITQDFNQSIRLSNLLTSDTVRQQIMSSLFNIGRQQGCNDPLCYTILYNLKKYIPDRINTGNAKIKLKEQYALTGIAGTTICLSNAMCYVLSCSYEISCVYLPNEQLFLVIHPPGNYRGSCKMENQNQNIDRSDRVEARRVHADDDT
ncbi:hypothetical protein G5I_07646 [Acromyrmex echinatior]|uniref:Uncharacterized protein n=1 Tax=Acromyrmex echinatior TaxID=103372 RepID=F4WP83_ACREC|nr:hypothetical protein G5I_07646 [Acromyrmex echinatior]